MVIDQLYSKARNDADKEKYRDMYYSTVNSTEEETIKTVQELLDDRNVANALRWSEDVFEKAAKSPYFNKITGANKSIIDTLNTRRAEWCKTYNTCNWVEWRLRMPILFPSPK
jgi:Trk K+ transport system NAD-binding subunit